MSLKQLFDLTGRTALVTGGSRGLGLQIAETLGEQGARVALVARKAAELDAAKAHLQSRLGIDALSLVCDLSDVAAIPPVVEQAIAVLGPIDILVNNAGTTWGAATLEHPLEAWNKVMALNLTAMFVITQEVGRRCMVPRRRGKIINIASILGLVGGGDPGRAPTLAYNTSKGGVISFTRSLAVEWAQYAINVNAIAPGFFPTKMTQGVLEAAGGAIAERAPLRRVGGAEDLKGLVALFASDASAFITGQIVAVDGGTTAA
ncbi:MAG TPA: SDR family oxidoreductase [Casimicrobiaceae bacterium]|jgi:gluconate 5-dehydrogenase|nr:SDR family oxidoreductase [Casimicrobiaceae bacterium]